MFKTKNYTLRIRNGILEDQVYNLNQECKRLVSVIKQYDDRVEQENKNAEFAVDWKKINAFSVERIYDPNSGKSRTVIGHLLETAYESGYPYNQIREWNLNCSIEKHNELAAEFKERLKK